MTGTRAALPPSVLWSALLVFLLTFTLARSTVTAAWVPDLDVVTLIALGGAVLMGVLAVTPMSWAVALAIWFVLGPVVAAVGAAPTFHVIHAADPSGVALLSVWWSRLIDGSAIADSAFDLYLICWLMWVTGGWLAWCVLRWSRPLLGLVPGAAAFATNLLNFPTDQNGYVLAVLVLTLALLLWSNYTASIASAVRARVKLTGDARWDFWESGLVAMAALIVLAILLPPMSTVDRTVDIESSLFTSWAQLMNRLSHPGQPGQGQGSGGTTGFSLDVPLAGSLTRTKTPVFTYTWTGEFAGARYFRGVNETVTSLGEWRYPFDTLGLKEPIAKDEVPAYAEQYQKLAVATFSIDMLTPPGGANSDILFYPGQLEWVDRPTMATESLLPQDSAGGPLTTIDRLASVRPPVSNGTYKVTVEYSTATDADLRAAGTAYPAWLSAYIGLPAMGYRTPDVLARIHALAEQIVKRAGAQTPYDQATAIEAYLRTNYRYTLQPPLPTDGSDRLAYFLFNSMAGYCQFFATAMGDMLRSLGIPTRLVNGFGPGSPDAKKSQMYVVRDQDAHTWVESYFPGYGWIPFEPTNDGFYQSISRGASGSNVCLRNTACDAPGGVAAIGAGINPARQEPGGPNAQGNTSSGGSPAFLRMLDPGTLTKVVGVLLALFLVAFAAMARYLRPRSVMGVWRRTLALARLAGAERRGGETPFELGRRLAFSFPEAAEPIRSLADGFVVAAYAPPETAPSARSSVMEAWSALRPLLVRRVFGRIRRHR